MNEKNLSFQEKQQTVICCQWSNLRFQTKIRILENFTLPPQRTWQFPKTENVFLMRSVVTLMKTVFWCFIIKCVDFCNNWKCSPFSSFMLTELLPSKMLPFVISQAKCYHLSFSNLLTCPPYYSGATIHFSIYQIENKSYSVRQREREYGIF